MEDPVAAKFLCFCHVGGKVVKSMDGSLQYEGGQTVGVSITPDTTYDEFVAIFCAQTTIKQSGLSFKYTTKFLASQLVALTNDRGIKDLVSFNDGYAHVYIFGDKVEDRRASQLSDQVSTVCQMDSNAPGSSQFESFTDGVPTFNLGYRSTGAVSESALLDSAVWANVLEGPGQTFPSAHDFRNSLYKFSLAHNFRYKWIRNSPSALNVHCTVKGCPWKVTARAVCRTSILKIITFVNTHCHSAQELISVVPIVRAKRVASILEAEIRQSPDLLPTKICADMKRKYGMNVSYKQAWRVKEKTQEVIRGNVSHSYKLLPWLCNRLREINPGTTTEWTCEDDGSFKQLFIAYGCSISGFLQGCRPIIAIDSSFLSGPYKGVLLSATAYNGDDEMFPLAYGIVNSKNYEDWLWFLQHLKKLIGRLEVTILSDRHNAILQSVGEVFGSQNHSYCYMHMKEDFRTQVTKKNTGGKKGKEDAVKLLDAVAYSRLDKDYKLAMANLETYSSYLAKWVDDNGPEHWAQSKFPNKRWDKMTTNLAGLFNSWVRKDCHSVIEFVKEHHKRLGSFLHKHVEEMKSWKGPVGPNIEKILQQNIARGRALPVVPYLANIFFVGTGNAGIAVDLIARECACMAWQMSGIPCEHACATLKLVDDNVYAYVDECYYLSTQQKIYHDALNPVSTHDMPSIDSLGNVQFNAGDATNVSLNPPKTKRPPGRPRQGRNESSSVKKRPLHCSLCHEEGHNRASCKIRNRRAR